MPGSKAGRSKEKDAMTPTSTLSKFWGDNLEILRPINPGRLRPPRLQRKGHRANQISSNRTIPDCFSHLQTTFSRTWDIEDVCDEDLEVPETQAKTQCQDARVNNLTEPGMYNLEKSKLDLEFAAQTVGLIPRQQSWRKD